MRALPFVLLIAACTADDPAAEPVFAGCPAAYCGSNSPTIDHYGFHELDVQGQPNSAGLRILGTSVGNEFYGLRVTDGRITAVGPTGRIGGSALIGARIYVEHTTGSQFALTIEDVSYVREVVPPYELLETYRFQWGAVTSSRLAGPVRPGESLPLPALAERQDVCPDIAVDPASAEWDEARAMPVLQALVYEGDRIDTDRRTVRPRADARWFNIGCGHDTLVKLRLTRSTMLTSGGNWRLVQATLKMLSADYCGTGKSFTMRGEPLVWRSRSGMELHASPTSFEARWDENGAQCLDVPRATTTSNADLAAMFPDIERAIASECARPRPCARPDIATFEARDLVLSGNVDR